MELTFENYTNLKLQGLKRAEIANEFSIPEWKLKKHIAANNWGKASPVIGNESAFDDYSEESCYWAGFIAADGNVDSKNRIRVMLKYDDILHLEKLREYLKSTHSISSNTTTYNRCSFEITSAHIREMLEFNFNIVPNKTDKYKLPSIPKAYLRHYVRGYFDGDGSICESLSNINSITATLYATFSSGSAEFIKSLYNRLNTELNLGGHLQDFNTRKKWQIKYNTNDAKSLLAWMYENSTVYLERKYNLYSHIVVHDNRKMRER